MAAQHIFVGYIPHGTKPGDEVLITIWDAETATIATRPDGGSWGGPDELEPRPTE